MKKITYHSNSQYCVCCKIVNKDKINLDKNLKINGNILEIIDSKGEIMDKYCFNFNQIFMPNDDKKQQDFIAKTILYHIDEGINGCIMSYGPQYSEKNTTIFGDINPKDNTYFQDKNIKSIAEQSIQFFLNHPDSNRIRIKVNLIDIYINQIKDLGKAYLKQSETSTEQFRLAYLQQNCEIIEDQQYTKIKDCEYIQINSIKEFQNFLKICFKFRHDIDTPQLDFNQNSHTILRIFIILDDDQKKKSKITLLNLVELASCRSVSKKVSQGDDLQNNLIIKNSFNYLSECLQGISNSTMKFSVFKQNPLTNILKDCLQIQNFIVFIPHLHICQQISYESSLQTLFYADHTRKLVGEQKKKPVYQDMVFINKQKQINNFNEKQNDKILEEKIQQKNQELSDLKIKYDKQQKVFFFIIQDAKNNLEQIIKWIGLNTNQDKIFQSQKYMEKGFFYFKLETKSFKKNQEALFECNKIQQQIQDLELKLQRQIQYTNVFQKLFQEIKKEEFAKQERLISILIEQKDQNKIQNELLQINRIQTDFTQKQIENEKETFKQQFQLNQKNIIQEKFLQTKNIPEKEVTSKNIQEKFN